MDQYIITTTPTIEGHPTKAFLGVINTSMGNDAIFFSNSSNW